MKNIRKKIKRISAGAATGLIIMLIPLALSAQQTWRAARGFSQPEKTGQVKVRKTASTATSLTFEYSLPSASFKNGSTITSAGQIEVGSTPQRQRAGEPNIPVIPVQVVLPAGTTLEKAVVTTDNSEEIAGSHRIEHGQKPVPLNGKGSRTVTSADAKIYGSDAPYPAGLVEVVGIQKKRGVTIALLNIFPVTYHPQSGKIIIFKTLTLKVITKPLTGKSGTVRVPSVQEQFFPSVENPEELDSYRKGADISGGEIQPLGICNPSDSYRYVIVTADSFATATTDVTVRDLIAQKQARGISATIVTIENVKAGYTGVDDAERLRNFIIDAYSNWETEFVLLGGDINIIPLRKLYCNGGGEIDQIPSDLYYQCLDGNYNSDNDSYWGETTDGPGGSDVDLMAEVFIGRASAETRVEMSNFVYKTLAYENATESSPYLRKAMMVGEELGFGGVSEYATATMEEIRLGSSEHGYTTAGFASSSLFTVDTLYDRSGYSWASSEIISRMNSNNFGIFNHLGHANATYVMKFYNADADVLTNTNPFFAYSQGCIPGNFEVDCIAEHLTTSHRRGAFAVVFNARYGWGQFNSTDGPSQRFDRQFWDAYFSEYMINLGALNADSHEDNLWDINGDCIRWCYYETNLLGDPQTPIRGLVNGPMVQYNSHIFNDNAGNGDGLINPGERIVVLPTLANVGSESAAGVTMTLSTTDSYIAMVDNSASAGTIACCGAVQQALDNMVFNVASNCPTPHTVPFTLTMRNNNGGEWTAQFSMTVYTSSQVSGYVRASASGAALPNATVSFSGPLSGTVTTDASGRYLFGGINGTYSITAVASGYLQSSPLTVILPPAQTNVDFNLVRPRMGLTPGSMHVDVPSGGSGTRTLTVSNSGDAALSFSIASRDMTGTNVLPAEVLYSSEHFAMQTKGMTDRRIGKPVVLGRGGPDQFGYRWTDSDESGGPSYQWTDIRNTGTLLSTITGCDDCYQSQALSFQFPFYGNTFSTIYVSSNGYITFGSGNSNYGNYALPSTSMPPNLIAAYFDDLYPGSSGDIYFQDFGNKAIVQFTNVAPYSGSGTLTFQTVIEQNGSIYFYYNAMTGTLTSTTAGIQNSTQNDGLTVVYNAAYLKNNLAVRLRPVPDWLTVTPESGTVPAGGSNSLTVQFSSEGLNGGFNYGALEFTHNDPALITPYLFPCTLYVDGMRRLAVNPSTINFGNNQIGSYDTVLITLTNSGDEPTTVSGITSSASQFTHNVSLPLTVPSFGSVPIRAIYHPLTIGNHTGTLSIISNAEDNPSINIPMSGAGVPAPDVAVTPVSFSKILSAGSSATDILTINNTGGDVLTYSISIADVAASSRVVKARNSSDSTIENGLRLPPDFVMPQSNGNLAVTYPFFDGFESGNWNNWTAGTGSYTRSVTNATAASGSNSFTLTGGNSEHFDGVSAQFASEQSPTEVSFAVRANDPDGASGYFVLGPTGSCPIFFFMAPEGVFYVNDYTTVTYQPNVWYRIRYLIDWTAHTFDLYIDGTLITSDIAFRDAVNSINTVYLYNYYSAQAWWDNINIGGASASDWLTVSPITGSVASGEAAQVQVGFNSVNMNGGTYQKEIRITTNVPGRESVIVPVSMTVDGMPRLSVTPLQYTYPTMWAGATATANFTLANAGNEPTVISSVTSGNQVFTPGGTFPLTVPSFGEATISVAFHPATVGTFSTNLTFTSNAEDNPSIQVSLSGTATSAPAASLAPRELTFNMQPSDVPADQTSVLINVGGAPLSYVVGGIRELSNPLANFRPKSVPVIPDIRYDLIYNEKNYENEFVPGRVIVAFKEGMTNLADASLISALGVKDIRKLAVARTPSTGKLVAMKRSVSLYTFDTKDRTSVLKAIEVLRYDANVAFVEPDYVVKAIGIPNDPSFSQLYAMHNTGQTSGTPDADIDAPEAWDVHTGDGSILIGIIDTGIDYVHPDLVANIWTNPGEIANNGIDDDGNGFIDDIHGWDFANDDSNPTDGHGHGTHCSGTIAGNGNNGIGVAGVMWHARLVALKFLTDDGSGTTTDAIDAVNYAAAMGINITSNSWGGGAFSQALMDAIATQDLFIAAAGNDGANNDSSPHYPSSYELDNIIAVAATDHNDALASFSCYGATSVDLGAPGVNIYSCAPGSSYQSMSGTSMATPHVSGAAGLLWTYNTMLTALEVKQILLSSTDPKSSLSGITVSGGRLNVAKALDAAGPSWLSVSPTQAGVLAPGGELTYTVKVTPQGLTAGIWRGAVLVNTNDPLKLQDSILVTANIAACRSLSASANTLDFENIWVNSTTTRNLVLTNDCNSPVIISTLTITGAVFSSGLTAPITVPAFGSVTIPLTFAPSETQHYTGILTLNSNANDNPVLTVTLEGDGTRPPAISVNPLSMRNDVSTGAVVLDSLFIRNTGGDVLTYSILGASSDGAADLSKVYSADHFQQIQKGAADPRIGDPVTLGSGGPDASGYRWIDSDEQGGPVYYWRDISGTGTNLSSISGCDDCYQSANLSFAFPFYGTNYTTLYVSSNGYITFGTGSSQLSNYPLPSNSMPANQIAAFMDDLYPSGSGDIYFQDFGDSAYVQFNNVAYYSGSGTVTFQMVLYRNGTIMFRYRSMTGTVTSSTTGIQNGTQDVGLNIAYNTSYVHNNLAVKIYTVPHWLRLARIQGSVDPGETDTIQATFDATGIEPGQVSEILQIMHNAPSGANPFAVPCTMTVDGIRRLSATPLQYTYPPVWNGGTANSVITLINDGNEPTTVSSITSSNSVFAAAGSVPVIVPAYGSVTLNVGFTPIAVGSYSGTISLTSNAEDNPVLQVSLTGTCVNGPDIAVTPGSINVSLAPDATATRTMNIRNNGGANLNFEIQFRATGVQNTGSHDILIINDGSTGPTLDTLLTNAGYNVTMVSDDAGYNGTNPSLDGFAAVVLTDGTDYGDDMPAAGQTAIANYVNNGGGLVTLEWIGYEIENGRYSTLAPLIPFIRTSGSSGTETYSISSTHPVTEGLSGSFTLSTGTSIGVVAGNGCLGVVTGSVAGAAVVVAERGEGKVVSFASSGNYNTYRPFGNQNLRRLFTNAVGWVAQSTPSWLTLGISEGEVIPGNSTDVLLTFNSAGLAAGTYGGELAVQHNSPLDVNPMIIPVTLVVNENGGGYISAVTSIGISALVKAQGTRYSLSGITLGAPVTGTLQGNRYRLSLW